MKKLASIIWLLSMIALMVGCRPAPAPEDVAPGGSGDDVAEQQGVASPTPPPIPTQEATATNTPLPTATVTPTWTPTSTATATQTEVPPTLTPVPTSTFTATPIATNTVPPTWTSIPATVASSSSDDSSSDDSSSDSDDSSSNSDDDKLPKTSTQGSLNKLNKVANPNFTTGSYQFTASDGTKINNVPTDWKAWSGNGSWPEFYQEGNPQHILGDWAAWSFTTAHTVLHAGIYQKFFDLQPGAVYRANCWAFAYAGEGTPGSKSTGWIRIKLGIDPKAGSNPDSSSVLWSIENANMLGSIVDATVWEGGVGTAGAYEATDIYDPYTVFFTAIDNDATIWFIAEGDFAYPRSGVTVDSCEMHAQGWASDFGLPMP